MVRKVQVLVLLGMFWTGFLYAESGIFYIQEKKQSLFVSINRSEDDDALDEESGWKTEEYQKKKETGKKGLVRWEYENKLTGGLRGGLYGTAMLGTVGNIAAWVALPSLIAGLSFFGPFGALIAVLIAAMLIIAAYSIGFISGIPYGVAKTGNAHGENGKMWAAYLGAIVNIVLVAAILGSGKSISSGMRVLIGAGGLVGMVGMPILFYNLSRSRPQEKPEVGIKVSLLTVRF